LTIWIVQPRNSPDHLAGPIPRRLRMPQVVGIDHIAITVSNLSNLAIDSKLRGCDV